MPPSRLIVVSRSLMPNIGRGRSRDGSSPAGRMALGGAALAGEASPRAKLGARRQHRRRALEQGDVLELLELAAGVGRADERLDDGAVQHEALLGGDAEDVRVVDRARQ